MSNKLNYLDKKGLAKVFSLIKFGHKKIWHGTLAEWEALSTAEKAEYDQAEVIDEYTGVPVVVDKVEAGNLNPVTSNAVAEAIAANSVFYTEGSTTITPTPQYGAATITFDRPLPTTKCVISVESNVDSNNAWGTSTKIRLDTITLNSVVVEFGIHEAAYVGSEHTITLKVRVLALPE